MSRTIQFRVWDDIVKAFWHQIKGMTRHGILLTSEGTPALASDITDRFDPHKKVHYFEATHLVVEQFTGLTDKNGRDIYEGDIVRYPRDTPGVHRGDPHFDTSVVEYDTDRIGQTRAGFRVGGDYAWQDTTEVIGNVHQHPELLT